MLGDGFGVLVTVDGGADESSASDAGAAVVTASQPASPRVEVAAIQPAARRARRAGCFGRRTTGWAVVRT